MVCGRTTIGSRTHTHTHIYTLYDIHFRTNYYLLLCRLDFIFLHIRENRPHRPKTRATQRHLNNNIIKVLHVTTHILGYIIPFI